MDSGKDNRERLVFSVTREELYQRFGPKLIDAQVRAQMKFNNRILRHLDLPELSLQDAVDAIVNELESIPDYDWMKEA